MFSRVLFLRFAPTSFGRDPKERAQVFGQYDHVRIYGKDYQERLEQVGFTVKMLAYAEQLTFEEQTRYAVPANEIIPVCTKAN